MLKVKIVCTIGPASSKIETLKEMVAAGMNVARLNFSHGDYESHGATLRLIRQAERETGVPLPALLDTKGPEIRTGEVEGGAIILENGHELVISAQACLGTPARICVNYPLLAQEVKVGEFIYIDDGTLQVQVQEVRGDDVVCKVTVGGRLSNRKGVNMPGANLSLPALSDKDKEDIRWGVENGMEYIAVSFVKCRADIWEVRRLVEELSGGMKIIAKIETRQAVENIDEITDVVDGVMVARGDLGVEIATEEVPLVQKRIIEICRSKGKVVIVATQMLDSMIRNPRPTRAEASDVANAVFDGTDAVMLSGETAGGLYPLESVRTMRKIVSKAESELHKWCIPCSIKQEITGVPDAVSRASVLVAEEIDASAIISLTKSGISAHMVSKHRPDCKILAATPSVTTWRQLALWWGVISFRISEFGNQSLATDEAISKCLQNGMLNEGELVVLTGGVPFGQPGTTNMLEVHPAAVAVASGLSLVRKSFSGRVCIANSADEAMRLSSEDSVLILRSLDGDYVKAIERAGAVITESSNVSSKGAFVALERNIPCITGVPDAINRLSECEDVTIDGLRGQVYRGRVRLIV